MDRHLTRAARVQLRDARHRAQGIRHHHTPTPRVRATMAQIAGR